MPRFRIPFLVLASFVGACAPIPLTVDIEGPIPSQAPPVTVLDSLGRRIPSGRIPRDPRRRPPAPLPVVPPMIDPYATDGAQEVSVVPTDTGTRTWTAADSIVARAGGVQVASPVPAVVRPSDAFLLATLQEDTTSSDAASGGGVPQSLPLPVPPVAFPVDTASVVVAPVVIDSAAIAASLARLPRIIPPPLERPATFASEAERAAWEATARRVRVASGLFVLVSLETRTLYAVRDGDTLRIAPVAVGSGQRLVDGKRAWVFETPRGMRTVRGKTKDPVWQPPLWHYVETAQRHGLALTEIPHTGRLVIGSGRRIEVRDQRVGVWTARRGWTVWPLEDEVVIDGVLYVPPIGTKNRAHEGELGPFKLDLGNGYLLHGTPDQNSIGQAVTHGCVRLADEDLEWLYQHIPVGTPVFIL